jgi:hypothetical protein
MDSKLMGLEGFKMLSLIKRRRIYSVISRPIARLINRRALGGMKGQKRINDK